MDYSNSIIEDIKWFLYGDNDVTHNSKGFSHDTEFVSWVGNGHSFIIKRCGVEYRITISKEE